MTYKAGFRPPQRPRLGPSGCATMVVAFLAGFVLVAMASNGSGAAAAVGVVAVVAAFVLLAQRWPVPRAVGTGMLAGFAVALLAAGACFLMVSDMDV